MKKFIKAIILHLPFISGIYRRYCSVEERLHKQSKSLKKLDSINRKQDEAIVKLLLKIEEKDKQIERLSQKLQQSEEKLRREILDCDGKLEEQRRLSEEQEKSAARQLELLGCEIRDVRSAAEENLQKLKDSSEALNRETREKLSREILKANTQMKNTEKDLRVTINRKYVEGLHRDRYKELLTQWLYERVGEVGNLDNPRTFNEKIQWIKLHADNELYTKLADKYLVRDWVAGKIGEEYLIPLIGAWDNFDDINFDEFPEKFVLKANHGCKYNYIVYDKNGFNKTDARNKFSRWMRENFAWNTLELQYKNIPKKIIAEEYIENSDKNLNDYKIFCFNGKPTYIAFYTERKDDLRMAIFDLNWNLMPFTSSIPQYTGEVERPAQLEEMIRLAGILAEGFPHVRVDFYLLNDGSIKFGEMTFTTSSGFCKWQPAEYNRILGDMITLPIENK